MSITSISIIVSLIAIIGSIVSWVIIWRVDRQIERTMNLTGKRISTVEADVHTMKSRLGGVEQITAKHSQELNKLNKVVFDKPDNKT